MKDFKQNTKMMCEGGHYKKGGDVKQDKQMIKKAFKMHDDQLHEKKHTDLSKLKTGGGVKKYGLGGSIIKAASKGAASQLIPAAMFGPPAAMAVYSDLKSKDRAEAAKQAAEEAAKDKEADTKSAPVTKKRGGSVRRKK